MPKRKPAPPAATPESFHSHHSPFGAFASFTLGFPGRPGGFGHALRGPARQNVYIGFKPSPRAKWRLLPFFTPPQWDASAFTGEAATPQLSPSFYTLASSEYTRHLGWASDTWTADSKRFAFSLLSPFGPVEDPAKAKPKIARSQLSPHLNAWIEFDNSTGKSPAQLIFGVGEPDRLFRPIQDVEPRLQGFAVNNEFGYATEPSDLVESRQGFDILAPKFKDYRGLHVIGGESALVFTVPAGEKLRFPLALAFYNEGIISSGIPARYAYTRLFKDLEHVLRYGLAHRERYEQQAAERDSELAASQLDPDQQFLLAQATHSYYGCTQLLWSEKGPLWIVNEGEYRMMNTFDLTVDHLFFELKYLPWAARDALDLFAKRYAYTDRLKLPDGKLVPGGISFTHDMGVLHNFTPKERSSYECDGLTGCFSHMTMEQLLNWVIAAVTYAEKSGDARWLLRQSKTLLACAESLRRRDHPDPLLRDGILKLDSARCGPRGAEITTYDSLDVSLGQARNNLYLAVKTLGAWILLEQAFRSLGLFEDQDKAAATADLLAKSIAAKFDPGTGTFPAVFEQGNASRIIPAIEGFAYPLFLNIEGLPTRFAELLGLLGQHLAAILQPGVCLDPTTGGWKMSSTSTNTWFSKIALCQYVARSLFPDALTPSARAADKVHADWQRQPGCGAFAMCDQIHSHTGATCGSRYYPRGVTAILWLEL